MVVGKMLIGTIVLLVFFAQGGALIASIYSRARLLLFLDKE